MISYLYGELVQKSPTYLVIDVGGLGYFVNIPLSSYERVGEVGASIRVLTYLYVRDDAVQLFGFATEEERELFGMLIGVAGVGPRLAQAILSGMSVDDFKRAVAGEDLRGLTSISGVGRKTAQRLILELKDRFEGIEIAKEVFVAEPGEEMGPAEEAILALVSLGMDRPSARRAVAQVIKREGEGLSAEEIIKRALRQA